MNVYVQEIVIPAFNRTNKNKGIRKWIFGTSLSSGIGALLVFKTFLDWEWQTSILGIAVVLFLVYIVFFIWNIFGFAYKFFIQLYKESIYGDAIILLKDAFAKIHSLKRIKEKNGKITNKDVKGVLISFCDNLREIYNKKTKSNCSVCIKVVVTNNLVSADSEVVTFCRDRIATKARDYNKKYKDRAKAVKHYIFNNSCYNDVFDAFIKKKLSKLYYLNNSLPETIGYRNSSDSIYGQNLSDIIPIKERKKGWQMPYKSEIVVPIMPAVNEILNEYEILGFLCVDCDSEKVFDEKYDIPIIQGVADGIYDVIKMLT